MEIKIKKLSSEELDKFIALIKVFEMKNFILPEKTHLSKLLSKPEFMVFIALKDEEVIAGMTAYTLEQYYNEKPLAYIYDLAVLEKYQRKGIGKKLIEEVNNYCRMEGYEEVFVQADKVDDYALDFYRSSSPTTEEQVVHFSYQLNT